MQRAQTEYVIGIDIGNSTTEAAFAKISEENGVEFMCSRITPTTGIKGTVANIEGIKKIVESIKLQYNDITISKILINNAAPVIADYAMDTITETVITDSTMIGHNPDTPGGEGLGLGYTHRIDQIPDGERTLIVVVTSEINFKDAAKIINDLTSRSYSVNGAIVQNDEGTLINNRLKRGIPIVDEVKDIENVPLNNLCAVEVAPKGYSIEQLSNPYGIATIFNLDAKETEYCKYIAKSLIGNKSAVIIKTPKGDIKERIIPAGEIIFIGEMLELKVRIDSGAKEIMKASNRVDHISDVRGEPGTNIGGMLEMIKVNISRSTPSFKQDVKISDVLASDIKTAIPIKGGLANEYAMETGVAVAALVYTEDSLMQAVSSSLENKLGIPVNVCGVEGEMALEGAITTPGTALPLAMVDVGGGSTDGALMLEDGTVRSVHLAGAGNMIDMIINSELNLDNMDTAERIKLYPLGYVDTLHRVRYENGDVDYFKDALDPKYYGRTVTVAKDGTLSVIETSKSMDEIRTTRRHAKKRVLTENVVRVIDKLGVYNSQCKHVILVGGSFLDSEAANMVTEELINYKLSAGKGNIRGIEGPRNAVSTGLINTYAGKATWKSTV